MINSMLLVWLLSLWKHVFVMMRVIFSENFRSVLYVFAKIRCVPGTIMRFIFLARGKGRSGKFEVGFGKDC